MQILRTCIGFDVISMDPRTGADMISQAVVRMLFAGLVRLDDHLIPQLELAESYEMSPDFKTYVFTLKKCQWSDGSPITAYDFERSWKAALTPTYASVNTPLFFFIKNGKKASLDPSCIDQLGVSALDDTTLKIELEHPNPHLLNVLIHSVFSPVHQSMQTSTPDANTTICSGPFQLKQYLFQNQIVLERNSHYWKANQIQIDEIHYYIVKDQATALLMFEKEEVDWLGYPLSPISADAIPSLKKTGKLKLQPIAGTMWLFLNNDRVGLNNPHIRRALAYSIDREKIQRNILHWDEINSGLGLIPKVLKKEKWHPWFQDHDTQLAQNLFKKGLDELGITLNEFPPIKILHFASKHSQTILLAIQEMWERTFGIKVSLEGLDSSLFFHQYRMRDFDIACSGWVAQYNDPISLLELFKYNNPPNYTGWENPDFIRYTTTFSTTKNNQKRWESAEAAEKIFCDEMPSIPLIDMTASYLVQPNIKNLAPTPLLHIDFDRAIIE